MGCCADCPHAWCRGCPNRRQAVDLLDRVFFGEPPPRRFSCPPDGDSHPICICCERQFHLHDLDTLECPPESA